MRGELKQYDESKSTLGLRTTAIVWETGTIEEIKIVLEPGDKLHFFGVIYFFFLVSSISIG